LANVIDAKFAKFAGEMKRYGQELAPMKMESRTDGRAGRGGQGSFQQVWHVAVINLRYSVASSRARRREKERERRRDVSL